MEKLCVFCDNAVEKHNTYTLCHNCQAICYTTALNNTEILGMINEHIHLLLHKASNLGVDLHVLEQKYMLGQPLTDEEISLRSLLLQLQDIRLEVSVYSPTDDLHDLKFRKIAYRLIYLSEAFEDFFMSHQV